MAAPLKEINLDELYKLIDMTSGAPTGHRQVRAEIRDDPVVRLSYPLKAYGELSFFYLGLFEGFCRPDGPITERFRADTGAALTARRYFFDHPLFTIPWFPDFVKTNVARGLHSVETSADQDNFFDYVTSQLIIDRRRSTVWKIAVEKVKIPDPVMLDKRETPSPVEITVFLPYLWNSRFRVIQKSGMVIGTPEIRKDKFVDTKLKLLTDNYLK